MVALSTYIVEYHHLSHHDQNIIILSLIYCILPKTEGTQHTRQPSFIILALHNCISFG